MQDLVLASALCETVYRCSDFDSGSNEALAYLNNVVISRMPQELQLRLSQLHVQPSAPAVPQRCCPSKLMSCNLTSRTPKHLYLILQTYTLSSFKSFHP